MPTWGSLLHIWNDELLPMEFPLQPIDLNQPIAMLATQPGFTLGLQAQSPSADFAWPEAAVRLPMLVLRPAEPSTDLWLYEIGPEHTWEQINGSK